MGVFLFCFEAQDKAITSSQNALLSTASPFNFDGTLATDQTVPPRVDPSCLFVESLEPAPNPSPTVEVCEDALCSSVLNTCSEDCCGCCGYAQCLCEQTQPCCSQVQSELQYLNRYTVRAMNTNHQRGLNFTLSFPCTPDTVASGNCLSPAILSYWQTNLIQTPFLAPIKYGCGGFDYDTCVSNPNEMYDATTQVTGSTSVDVECFWRGPSVTCRTCMVT